MRFDWITIKLGDFIELKRGYDLPKAKRLPGNVPIVSSSGESDFHQESKVAGPGVVTGRYGTIGEVFFIDNDFWPLNTTLYVVDFKGNCPKFVYYLLKTFDFHKYSDKAAVPGVNRNHVHQEVMCVPKTYSEQEKIADYLSLFDKRLELNTQTNQTLESIAQTLFKSWFVGFDPVKAKMRGEQPEGMDVATAALFPDKLVESDELGMIPEGWKPSTIGDETTVVGGGTPSRKNDEFWENGHIHWTSPKDLSGVQDKVLLDTASKVTETGLKKISSGLLPIDTVLLSSRAPVGYLALAKVPLAVNQGYIAMKCEKALTPEFVLQWCVHAMDDIKQRASGSTFAEISKKNFKPMAVVVPENDVIEKYTNLVKPLYDAITSNCQENTRLETLRNTLLPKLLSGELDLSQLDTEVA